MAAQLVGRSGRKTLDRRPLIIGRTPGNQSSTNDVLRINDSRVESRHAVIRPNGQGGYDIIAGPSVNGTWIRLNRNSAETRLEPNNPFTLQHGNVIRIGPAILIYAVSSPQTAQTGNSSGAGGLITLIVIILIVAGIAYYYSQNNSASTPEKTLSDYCTALKDNDYQTAYNQLANAVKSKETESQFASNLQQTFKSEGGLTDCIVGSTQEQGSTANGTLTYTFTKGPQVIHAEQLVEENGTWKISTRSP